MARGTPGLLKHNERGLLIAFEGIDQAGKETQSSLLAQRLEARGYKVKTISFPYYSTKLGMEIRAALEGRSRYPDTVMHMLLSANRWERQEEITSWLQEGLLVIVNRYAASNTAYGGAKGLDGEWLANLDRGLPEPDLTLLLDIEPQTSLARKGTDRDLYERDLELLNRVRREYLALATDPSWRTIDGKGDAGDVGEAVWEVVEVLIRSRPPPAHQENS